MKIERNIFILLAILSMIGITDAVPVEQWNKTFGGKSLDIVGSVKQTLDGGYILAGETHSYGIGDGYAWLIKIDANGNEQWNNTFGEKTVRLTSALYVQQTSDGGYAFVGIIVANDANGFNTWLVKTDTNGNKIWDKIYGASLQDWTNAFQQTSDGGYIIAGYSGEVIGGVSNDDAWLMKTDADGNKQWENIFGGNGIDQFSSVKQTSDGGYIIAGGTTSYGSGGIDAWIIKTDKNGDEEWSKIFGGIRDDRINAVVQSDGGYILAGYTESFGTGKTDVWLIKTDTNGNKQWDRTFGGIGSDSALSVQQTSDHGYILTGSTNSYGAEGLDTLLIKTDSNGSQQWNMTFGGKRNDSAMSVQQTSDGGYIVAGGTTSYGTDDLDAWLIKVSTDVSPVPTITVTDTKLTTTTVVPTETAKIPTEKPEKAEGFEFVIATGTLSAIYVLERKRYL